MEWWAPLQPHPPTSQTCPGTVRTKQTPAAESHIRFARRYGTTTRVCVATTLSPFPGLDHLPTCRHVPGGTSANDRVPAGAKESSLGTYFLVEGTCGASDTARDAGRAEQHPSNRSRVSICHKILRCPLRMTFQVDWLPQTAPLLRYQNKAWTDVE